MSLESKNFPPDSASPFQNWKSDTIYKEFATILLPKCIIFQQPEANSNQINVNNDNKDSNGIGNSDDEVICSTGNRDYDVGDMQSHKIVDMYVTSEKKSPHKSPHTKHTTKTLILNKISIIYRWFGNSHKGNPVGFREFQHFFQKHNF